MTPEQREQVVERSAFVWETFKAHAEKGRSSMPIYLDDLKVMLDAAEQHGRFEAIETYLRDSLPFLLAEERRAGAEKALRDAAQMIKESGAVLIPEWLLARANQIGRQP